MILYHFTTEWHFEAILSDGFIEEGCSDLMVLQTPEFEEAYHQLGEKPLVSFYGYEALVIHPAHRHAVSLTRNGNPKRQEWVEAAGDVAKADIRITVDIPEAEVRHWTTWSLELGCDPIFLHFFNKRGHGNWHLVERRIDRLEWTEVSKRTRRGVSRLNLAELPGPSGMSLVRPPRPLDPSAPLYTNPKRIWD